MMMRTTAKKLAAATALTGMLIGLAPGAASAGPEDDFEIEIGSKLPSDVTNPLNPLWPKFPPPEPTIPSSKTNARPIVDWVECYHDDYIVNFTDMDAPDLHMTVEIAFTHGLAGFEIRTMPYSPHFDAWFLTLPEGAKNVLIQATDEDGNFSHAITLFNDTSVDRHPTEEAYCNVIDVNVFNNDRHTDAFTLIGAR